MILSNLKKTFKYQIPVVTILLALSCLITSIPQLFMGDTYNQLTGSPLSMNLYWAFTLPAFSHAPQMLLTHTAGNLAILLLFGIITEQIIGSNSFAFLSLITLIGTSLLDMLHGISITHGASGIFWGYHLTSFFIIIVIYEQIKRRLFKEIFFWIGLCLLIFDLIGIPVMEVVLQKRTFFENFGQTIHLFSICLTIPYVIIKRAAIQAHTITFISGNTITYTKKKAPFFLLLLILLLNLVSTIYAILIS